MIGLFVATLTQVFIGLRRQVRLAGGEFFACLGRLAGVGLTPWPRVLINFEAGGQGLPVESFHHGWVKGGQGPTFGHFRGLNRRKSLKTNNLRRTKKCPVLQRGKLARGP